MPTLVSIDKDVEQQLLTAEEFLDWLQPSIYADLIGGETFMHSPVNRRHSGLLNFLDFLLRSYLEYHQIGQLERESIAVRFGSRDVFMPDLCYFTNEQAARLRIDYVDFAPTLIVEALSPTTAARDVGPKFAAYERYGVREYWILDPKTQAHRFYALEDGLFVEFGQGEDRIVSKSIDGFYVRRTWLDPMRPPLVRDCMNEIIGAAK